MRRARAAARRFASVASSTPTSNRRYSGTVSSSRVLAGPPPAPRPARQRGAGQGLGGDRGDGVAARSRGRSLERSPRRRAQLAGMGLGRGGGLAGQRVAETAHAGPERVAHLRQTLRSEDEQHQHEQKYDVNRVVQKAHDYSQWSLAIRSTRESENQISGNSGTRGGAAVDSAERRATRSDRGFRD